MSSPEGAAAIGLENEEERCEGRKPCKRGVKPCYVMRQIPRIINSPPISYTSRIADCVLRPETSRRRRVWLEFGRVFDFSPLALPHTTILPPATISTALPSSLSLFTDGPALWQCLLTTSHKINAPRYGYALYDVSCYNPDISSSLQSGSGTIMGR
ncbi:hypothetical protein K438DRAFT_1930199 [Mycena galopus ATCC 62051]|nr:hypothetical protein K438DRAFT_1930199 [Mycena galopus ATCC 62051]